jgi:hypothetical protein
MDPGKRYRGHLARFGIHHPGERLLRMTGLDEGGVRFFGYADAGGIRLKAAATETGLLAGGDEPRGDWYGFLTGMPSGRAAADRLAWLVTDESAPGHGPPPPPVMALAPGRRPARGIDPARWAQVGEPALARGRAGQVTLVAWLLAGTGQVPERWTVRARPREPAVITRMPAAAPPGGAARALALLAAGSSDERHWALTEVRGPEAVPVVAAALADLAIDAEARLLAAAALGRIGGQGALAGLASALASDPEPAVRRAAAHALGRLPGGDAGAALTAAGQTEGDVTVRAAIAQAARERAGSGRPA